MSTSWRIISSVFISIIVIVVSYNFIAFTDEPSLQQQVDALFSEVDSKSSPGAAIAILHNGEIVYSQGYGAASLEYPIPITSETIFHVASVSKQFTAFSVLLLAEQDKLSLDDDVNKYIPEFPDFNEKITIRHLIHHTSGLRDQWELLAMAGWRLDDVITREHILKMLEHQRELNFAPGDEYLYSNMGYSVLAEIVERVSGTSFKEWTTENIFKPLGMKNTHFQDDHRHIVPGRAYSYQPDGKGGYRKSVLNYANVGATSLFTTVEDLALWMKNFDDVTVGNEQIIKQMHRRGRLNDGEQIGYAYAMQVNDYRGTRIVGHSGADAGFRSYAGRFPEHNFAVIILSNYSQMSPQRIAYSIADIYLGDKLKTAETRREFEDRTTASIDSGVVESYVGKYKMERGIVISLTSEDDRLYMQTPGLSSVELYPKNETTFFRNDINFEITFQFNDEGEADHFTINRGSSTGMAIRIDGNKPTEEELHEYTGVYYSDELGTFYYIHVQENELIASHRRHSDIELTPIIQNRFSGNQWWFRTVEFVRDDNDIVEGFRLTGGRVRNVWFDKQQ